MASTVFYAAVAEVTSLELTRPCENSCPDTFTCALPPLFPEPASLSNLSPPRAWCRRAAAVANIGIGAIVST